MEMNEIKSAINGMRLVHKLCKFQTRKRFPDLNSIIRMRKRTKDTKCESFVFAKIEYVG